MTSLPDSSAVKNYLTELQNKICESLSEVENTVENTVEAGVRFETDTWEREEGGGGKASILTNGTVFEKAGVNFSHVTGAELPPSATNKRPELAGMPFEAMGVSLVLHPYNPYVPTTHANIRFFHTGTGDKSVWWFGGGFDLTPYYPFEEDCVHWHQCAKDACDPFGPDLYPKLKTACDNYFYMPHRKEARGIGGLFFDDYREGGFEQSFSLMRSVGDHFLPAYLPILQRRMHTSFGDREINFQHYRRGRYVEFNLVYDRGTLFGLQSGGRTESILMSLPPVVKWVYNWHPEPGSPEADLYENYLPPQDWLTKI